MKAIGKRKTYGDDNKNNKDSESIIKETSSTTSDSSDNEDTEKSIGSRRNNKSKLATNIVSSFFDGIFRDIEESQSVELSSEISFDNLPSVTEDTEESIKKSQSSQNTITSTTIFDLNQSDSFNRFPTDSNNSDYIEPPTLISNKRNAISKRSIATSPFKPREQPQQAPKPSVTIIYPQKPPQAQQRKQQEAELLQRAKQQKEEQKPLKSSLKETNKQQLILIDNQKNVSNLDQKNTVSVTNNTKQNSKQNQVIRDKRDKNDKKDKTNKKDKTDNTDSKTVYTPPMYDKKLSSLFDIVSSESDEPFTRDHIFFETSQAEMRDVFVFDIHEEGGHLYLFCKYVADPTQYGTICICVASTSLFLQFLPAYDISDDKVEKEVKEISKICDGEIISMKWLNKRSINSTLEQKYLEVELSSKSNIANIPVKGKTYEAVFGSTLSSTEHFIIRKNLKGPKWISVRCSQAPCQQTSIPMYTTLNPFDIEVTGGQIQKPSMNLCIFSIFERNGIIFMVSMRIFYQCNYETLDNYKGLHSARKSIITFIFAPEASKMPIKKDRTTMFCNTEAELLQNFAERIEQFDIDILCSYDLVNHDLPFIIERMKANNIKQWSKLGRHIRSVYPKKDSSFSLVTSGRMLLDLKSTFKNLFQIESDSFSSLVQTELEIDIPILNFDSGSFCLTDLKQMQELISFNRKITQFIKKILDNKNVISLSEHISRVTSCQWSQIMSEPPSLVIESLLLMYLHKKNYIIPDKKQQSEKYTFSPFKVRSGFYTNPTALISIDFLTAKIIQKKNLCFTTIDQLRSQKSNSVFPNIIIELLNTLKKLTKMEMENESSHVSLFQNNLYKDSIRIILNLIKPYFECGSQRFPVASLGQYIDNEIHQVIKSFGDSVILVSGKNDYDSILIEYNKSAYDDDDSDEIDSLIKQANVLYKHFDFKASEKYSRLLVFENKNKQKSLDNSVSFLGLDKEGERRPHNFYLYRYDWCPATKILVDNAIRIIMSLDDAENNIVNLIKEFPDTSQLQPIDFAITVFPPSAEKVELITNKMKMRNNEKNSMPIDLNINRQPVLRKVVDENSSDGDNDDGKQQNYRKFLSSSTLDDDFDFELELEDLNDEAVDSQIIENHDLFKFDSQLIEIMKKYEEKGRFVNIEGKICYIRCLNDVIKSVENVGSIDDEIDIEWYKKNQFFEAMKLTMKPFKNIISEYQIFEAFFGHVSSHEYYEINNDEINNIKLFFSCPNCNQQNVFTGINSKAFICQNCGIYFNWKYIANSLTMSIQKLLEKWSSNELKCDYYLCDQKREQLQLCDFNNHFDPCNPTKNCPGQFTFECSSKDIYDNLLSLDDLFDNEYKFDKDESEKDFTDDSNELSEYMKDYVLKLKEIHSFKNVRLSTLFSTQTQQSDTQIINDVCSFLDDE